MSFTTHTKQDLIWLTAPLLDGQDRIRHGFSTRTGGVSRPPFDTLNLALGRGDDPAAVEENYRRLCAVAGGDPARTVLSRQVHEDTVRLVTEADVGKGLRFPQDYTADALITNQPNLTLVVFSADCGILLLYDPKAGAIGAIHAGWRGCAAGIVAKTVRELQRVFGSRPADLLCGIGPCIGPCCFETDDDVPHAMTAALGDRAAPYLERRGPKWHVDLAGLNREWLLSAGVDSAHIQLCSLCTACHPELFWSHRKMGNARGGQVAMITLLSTK